MDFTQKLNILKINFPKNLNSFTTTFKQRILKSDVIDGTAVMPEWNGMTKIIEIEVPSTRLYGWYGKAAKQPASSTTTNYFLKGGEEQIIINFGQNQHQSISSITTSITSAPWIK